VPISESKKDCSLTTAPQPDPAKPAFRPSPDIAGDIDSLLKKHDVARRLRVSERTVDRMVAQRRIPFVFLGERMIRFRWLDVQKALNRMVVREVK
jgi:excisionase family DNA binding protein